MKTIEELNANKVPIVIIDKSLDKLDNVVLFPGIVESLRKDREEKLVNKKERCKLVKNQNM